MPMAAREPSTVAVTELVSAITKLFLNAAHNEGLSKISVLYHTSEAWSHCIPFALLKEKNTTTNKGMNRKTITRANIP
jgi:hypothetical protein